MSMWSHILVFFIKNHYFHQTLQPVELQYTRLPRDRQVYFTFTGLLLCLSTKTTESHSNFFCFHCVNMESQTLQCVNMEVRNVLKEWITIYVWISTLHNMELWVNMELPTLLKFSNILNCFWNFPFYPFCYISKGLTTFIQGGGGIVFTSRFCFFHFHFSAS